MGPVKGQGISLILRDLIPKYQYKFVFNLPESHKKTDKIKAKHNGIVKERSRIVICFYCVFFTFVGFFGTDAKNSNKRVSKLVGQVKLVAAQAK